jgi:hypothetical protein
MKCPNCDHVSDPALLKCSACGKAYDQATLETLQHLEYLLTWLGERAEILGSEAHARLREEALNQFDAIRGTLDLAPMPPPEEIASELALVEATLQRFQGWVEATRLWSTSTNALREYLVERAGDLKEDLAGRPIEVESPSALQVLDFALESLPLWAKELHLLSGQVALLRQYLDRERAALLEPAPPPAPAPEAIRPPAPPAPAPVTPSRSCARGGQAACPICAGASHLSRPKAHAGYSRHRAASVPSQAHPQTAA